VRTAAGRHDEAHLPHRGSALLDIARGDVVVAFDFRRYKDDTVEAAALAGDLGARVVLVTDVLMSPLATRAAIVLPVQVETRSPFDSAVAGVVVVEALALSTLTALGGAGLERMQAWDALVIGDLVGE